LGYHSPATLQRIAGTRPLRSFTGNARSSTKFDLPAVVTRQDLLAEAAVLTKSLYRTCLRSVRLIREGNDFDDKEFEKREADFLKPSGVGGRISMAPPPNKEDELRSRAEYYHSYTREYFIQESDCLDNDPLRERDIKRYLYYLRKGEKDRKWLLADMMFPDPYKDAIDQTRIDHFEAMAKRYLGEDEIQVEPVVEQKDSVHDNFFDADDENPEWFKTKYPHLK
jgi:hypothetical protein